MPVGLMLLSESGFLVLDGGGVGVAVNEAVH